MLNVCMTDVVNCWGLGDVHFGSVSGASIAYTLKYMMKDSQIPKHDKDDRTREFRKMSKGLGLNYLSEEVRKYHHSRPNDLFVRNLQGHIVAMPRVYRERLFTEAQQRVQNKNAETLNLEIQAKALQDHEKRLKKGTTTTPILEDYERQNSEYKNRKAIQHANSKRGDQ